jgi:hypothetical protein
LVAFFVAYQATLSLSQAPFRLLLTADYPRPVNGGLSFARPYQNGFGIKALFKHLLLTLKRDNIFSKKIIGR